MYTFVSYSVKPENHSFFEDLAERLRMSVGGVRGLPPSNAWDRRITRTRLAEKCPTNRVPRSVAAFDFSRLSAAAARQRRNASLTVMLAVRGNFFAINSVAINTNAPHRAKGFVRHQDALAIEILDLDAALLADVTLLDGRSRIHRRVAVQGHTTHGRTAPAPVRSLKNVNDTPWKGTML